MYVILATTADTSGGAPPYSYVRSFPVKEDAVDYAAKLRADDVARNKSWASHYEVFKKI